MSYIYIYIHIYIYMYEYINIQKYVPMYVSTHICIYIDIYIYTNFNSNSNIHTCTYVHIHGKMMSTHVCEEKGKYVQIQLSEFSCRYTCKSCRKLWCDSQQQVLTYTCIYVYLRTCTYTCI